MRIFVSVGTQDKPFGRMLEAIENSGVTEDIFIQSGFTAFTSKHYRFSSYLDDKEFRQELMKADVVVTHGGVGTIMQALRMGKKVIAMPRLAKYGEHQNDHQLQIISSFTESGYLLYWQEGMTFREVLEKIPGFESKKIPENQNIFLEKLKEYLKREL